MVWQARSCGQAGARSSRARVHHERVHGRKLQAGYVRHLKTWKGITSGLGGSVDVSLLPPELAPRYSGRLAPGFGVFLMVRPSLQTMKAHHGVSP